MSGFAEWTWLKHDYGLTDLAEYQQCLYTEKVKQGLALQNEDFIYIFVFKNGQSVLFTIKFSSSLACVAGAWKQWAQGALSSESQQRGQQEPSGTTDDSRKNLRNGFFSFLPPRTIAPWSLLSGFYRVVCYRYGVFRFNFLYMACFGGSYDTQNCCPNQTDSQTKVKLVSNWYEPKINNLQRQSEKD